MSYDNQLEVALLLATFDDSTRDPISKVSSYFFLLDCYYIADLVLSICYGRYKITYTCTGVVREFQSKVATLKV